MRYFNRRNNPNALAGLFLLFLLAVFAGPTVFPELLTNLGETITFIEIDEGVPCARLRTGEDRSTHQSLLGRTVSQEADPPISLSARTTSTSETFTISVIVGLVLLLVNAALPV